MITWRPAGERGITRWDWLDSRHTFSFADYRDPAHVHFRKIRVINDDRIAPGAGFPMHPHRDMEIVTLVFSGALEHKDSLGNGSVIRPGEVQRMTAGSGILHSEFNPSGTEPVHLLQIWIFPNQHDLTPGYEQTAYDDSEFRNRLRLVASGDGRDGSVAINQDASIYMVRLSEGQSVHHALADERHAWIQVATGSAEINGRPMEEGDGAAVSDESGFTLTARAEAELVVFDLA